jgi:protein-tyrosine phosphatase
VGSTGPRPDHPDAPLRILCVCLGNICRSPAAHAIFEGLLAQSKDSGAVIIDSAGTSASHAGEPPDARMRAAGERRGLRFTSRSRAVTAADFALFDHILAMDASNLAWLRNRCPKGAQPKMGLILDWHPEERFHGTDVPDPYYDGPAAFETVLNLLEPACRAFLQQATQAQGHEVLPLNRAP